MELDIDQRKRLHAALVNAIITPAAFNQLGKLELGINPNDILPNAGISDRLLELISSYEAQNEVQVLIQGILNLDNQKGNITLQNELNMILKSLKARKIFNILAPEPLDACILYNAQPFINRGELREKIQDMESGFGGQVLLINGSEKSGKSYTHFLLQYLALRKGIAYAYHDISPGGTITTENVKLQPNVLVDKINKQLQPYFNQSGAGIPPIPEQQNVEEQWVKELANWLGEQIPKGESCWIAIDGCQQLDESDINRKLVVELARYISTFLPETHLFLIDYAGELPDNTIADADEIEQITQESLVEYFKKIYASLEKEANDTNISQKAAELLQNIPSEPQKRLKQVNEQVRRECINLIKEKLGQT
jgi:hypothetical protein